MIPQQPQAKRKLLVFADGGCSTGFAHVAHEVLGRLTDRWDIHHCAINYDGDPHNLSWKLYPAYLGGDVLGKERVDELIERIEPDLVFCINDPWVVIDYYRKDLPCVTYVAIDAPNQEPQYMERLSQFDTTIFYTEFAKNAAVQNGFKGVHTVIPHGIDRAIYKPRNRQEMRAKYGMPQDGFIIGNFNRNSPRKNFGLTMMAFAQWVRDYDIPSNVYLYFHCAPKDEGIHIPRFARDLGISSRVLLPNASKLTHTKHTPAKGLPEEAVAELYSCLDVQVTSSYAEGWGLTTMEGMASGIPQIVPHWSAYSDWANGAAYSLEVRDYQPLGNQATLGAVPAPESYVAAFNNLYTNVEARNELRVLGLQCIANPAYSWDSISEKFHEVFTAMCDMEDLTRGE